MKRYAAIAAGLAVLALLEPGCSSPEQAPEDVVEAYYRALGRDPGRAIPLLTDAFHREHGLSVRGIEGFLWSYEGVAPIAARPGDPMLEWSQRPPGLASARAAWLMVQQHSGFQRLAADLRHQILASDAGERDAVVRVRVESPETGSRFEQEFQLVRPRPGEPWQIERVGERGVGTRQSAVAFVVHPHERYLEVLESLRSLDARRKRVDTPR